MKLNIPCFFIMGMLAWPGTLLAINFSGGSWSTTFNYNQECSQRGNLGNADCEAVSNDGIYWNWGAKMQGGRSTQATSAANHPNGHGGLGFRSWVGDGVNVQTGEARMDFPGAQKELWIRWYQRYQAGFAWSGGSPQYDKTLYIYTDDGGFVLPQHASIGKWANTLIGSTEDYQAISQPAITWNDIFGSTSDGQWHMFEIHIKMDTNGSNGISRLWIDGNRVINATNVDYSGGSGTTRQGWTWIEFHSNQRTPANGAPAYVDYDDIEIYRTTPPNTDANGLPWIGPIGGSPVGSPVPRAPAPVGISSKDPETDSIFAGDGSHQYTAAGLFDTIRPRAIKLWFESRLIRSQVIAGEFETEDIRLLVLERQLT